MKSYLTIAAGVVGLLAMLSWPSFRDAQVEAYRQALHEAIEATPKGPIAIGDRLYKSGELQLASAEVLIGPNAPRHSRVKPPYDDPVAVIADFRDRLSEEGIDLWVMPVPLRPWVAPDQVHSSALPGPLSGPYAEAYDELLDALRAEGVTTIDLLPPLRRRAWLWPSDYISATDPHWTGKGVVLAARILASRLKQQEWYTQGNLKTVAKWIRAKRPATWLGVKLPDEPDEEFQVRRVRRRARKDRKDRSVPVNKRSSPVLIMGDSHVRWLHNYKADIARQLSHETSQAYDTLPLVGGGSTRVREELARRAWADPEYLPSKKLVIWIFWTDVVRSQSWEVVALDPFEASKLQRRDRELRVDNDLHVVREGRGLASFDYRWALPQLDSPSDVVAWILKPDPATLSFPATLSPGDSLMLELQAKKGAKPVALSFDGQPLPSFEVPEGTSRWRLVLPEGIQTEGGHELELAIDQDPRPIYELGVRSLYVARSRPLYAETFDPVPADAGFVGFATEPSGSYPVSGLLASLSIDLQDPVAESVLRMRLRSTRGARSFGVWVNGEPVVTEQPVTASWAEHSVAVPAGLLDAGINTIEVRADSTEQSGRALAWDVVELDVPTEGLAPTRQR